MSIFNPLKLVAANPALSAKHPVSADVTHLSFDEEPFIFKTDFDDFYGIFVHQAFKHLVEKTNLSGLIFESDLANVFDRGNDTAKPASH